MTGYIPDDEIDDVLLQIGRIHFGKNVNMDTKLDINKPSKFWKMFEVVFCDDTYKESDFFETWEFDTLWSVKNYIVCRLW